MNQSIPTHESQVTELKEQLANEKTNARSLDREKTYYYMKNIQLEAQLAEAEGRLKNLIALCQHTLLFIEREYGLTIMEGHAEGHPIDSAARKLWDAIHDTLSETTAGESHV